MPRASGNRCGLRSGTPGPPFFTNHKFVTCKGFLHGICDAADSCFDDDMKRVCQRKFLTKAARKHQAQNKGAGSTPTSRETSGDAGGSTDFGDAGKSSGDGKPSRQRT